MAEPQRSAWLEVGAALFLFVAVAPTVLVFMVLKPNFGAFLITGCWLALMGVALFAFQRLRLHTPRTDPAAAVAAASLGLTFGQDRILEGMIDDVAVRAFERGDRIRIEARVREQGPQPDVEVWLSSLDASQRSTMMDAVSSGEFSLIDGWLNVKAPLSFQDPTHGLDLVFRLRELVRVVRTLSTAGPPPDGCVERLLEARQTLAKGAEGTLSLAQPAAAQGAISVAATAGALALPKRS